MNTISNPKCEASQSGGIDQIKRECPGASDGEKAIAASIYLLIIALSEAATAIFEVYELNGKRWQHIFWKANRLFSSEATEI